MVDAYINFAGNVCVPIKTVTVHSNNKPWFNREIWKIKITPIRVGIEIYSRQLNMTLRELLIRPRLTIGTSWKAN